MRVSGSLQADNAEVLRLAVLGGLGVALLPEWCIGADLKSGRLCALLPGFEATPFSSFDSGIYVVTQKSRHRSMKVQLFIDFLVRLFREREHWADALEQSPPYFRTGRNRERRPGLARRKPGRTQTNPTLGTSPELRGARPG